MNDKKINIQVKFSAKEISFKICSDRKSSPNRKGDISVLNKLPF